MIKPIETIYNGYKFRSRLEARWAVFFDNLGIEYRYEPEGFDMNGLWYLPDFWLPEEDRWIEVKPLWPNKHECEKAIRLCTEKDQAVTFLAGDIWNKSYKAIAYEAIADCQKDSVRAIASEYPFHWRSSNQAIWMGEGEDFSLFDLQRGYVCENIRPEDIFTPAPTDHLPENVIVMLAELMAAAVMRGEIPEPAAWEEDGSPNEEVFAYMKEALEYLMPDIATVAYNTAYTAARQARFEHRG